MKVRQCDICGITDKDILSIGKIATMHHFKVESIFGRLQNVSDMDICSDCLEAIRAARKGKRNE